MEVGAKFAGRALSLHRSHDLAPHYQCPEVGATGFADVLLDQEVGVQLTEGTDHRLGGLSCLGQHHSHTLGALEQLDHDRRTADHVQDPGDVLAVVGKAGGRKTDTGTGEDLHRAKLVPGSADPVGTADGEYVCHFELTDDGSPIEGIGGSDSRNDCMRLHLFTAKQDFGPSSSDVYVAAEIIDHGDLVSSIQRKAGASGEDGDLHVWPNLPGRPPR